MKNFIPMYSLPGTPAAPEIFIMPSAKMINTLKDCVKMESSHPGKPYGPADIGGSFLGLYKRGLVDIITFHDHKLKPGSWYVTTKGLNLIIAISAEQIGSN